MIKKLFKLAIVWVSCISLSQISYAETKEISVYLNGTQLSFDVKPQIINGSTYVPMRTIFEELGASVNWDDSTKTITGTKDNTTIKLKIGENKVNIDNRDISLNSGATIVNGRTLVPVRVVAESFNCEVSWDDSTKTINMSAKTKNETTKNYTSIEGDWVRVSYNSYYGSTMKIEKNSIANTYQSKLTSLSKNTLAENNFSVGDINLYNITPISTATYSAEILNAAGKRYTFSISSSDNFTEIEIRALDNYRNETLGDYQKWIRITEDIDVENMQALADNVYKVSLNKFDLYAYNSNLIRNSVTYYTKDEANQMIDNYVESVFLRNIYLQKRSELNKQISRMEKSILDYKNKLNDNKTTTSERENIQNALIECENQLTNLENTLKELSKEISNNSSKEEIYLEKYNELKDFYK